MKPFSADQNSAPVSVADAILQVAAIAPDAIAIEDGDVRIDYRSLVRRAASTAGALHERGVGAGSLIAVCLPRSADQIAAMLATWLAGGAYLPLDPEWPEARLSSLLGAAGCAALVANEDLGPRIAGSLPLIGIEAAGDLVNEPAARGDREDLAYVIYTSGSTGAPKAVEVTHGNLAALAAWHVEAFRVAKGTRTSHLAGLGFDAAAWEVWPTLAAAGTVCLADAAHRLDPASLRDWLVKSRVEVAFAPTVLAEPMVALAWPRETTLRTLLTGADRLKARPAPGLPFEFVNNYGPTECTVVATSGPVFPDDAGLPSIGSPIAGTSIHLLDSKDNEVAPGATGEICIGGKQVGRGYRDDPELTAAKFVEHPRFGRLYRTGDLAAWLPNGELDFRGRVDSQVKVRGHRIEPAEVAAALNNLPEVSTSAVAAHDGELVAYVVASEGHALVAGSLRGALAETLPDYMVPARFLEVSAMPLTANGKLDTAALATAETRAVPEAAEPRVPSNPTEQRLLEIVTDVIGSNDIGIDHDFFLVGGHSLLGTQLVVRARAEFGVELTLFHLFEGRTVARLAEIVERLAIELLDSLSDEEIRQLAAG